MPAVCLAIGWIAAAPAGGQFLTNGVIRATDTPKGSVFLTFDDGPDEPGPDGLTQMEKVARFLRGPVSIPVPGERSAVLKSIRASFAIVACHFIGQDPPNPISSLCVGLGDVPESVATNVIADGHDIFNHSQNHIPLTMIQVPSDVLYEVGHAQIEVDKLRDNSPRIFRGPGLAFSASVAGMLNTDPFASQITGPIDADVGGGFDVNGTWMGGDWDCFELNMSVPFCGDLYVNAIRNAPQGAIVLLHVRTESMTGRDGNPFPLDLARYIVENLGPDYDYLPLDAIPGVRGELMTGPVTQVSTEFGAADGQGLVAAGLLNGPGDAAGICKARGSTVTCKTSDGKGGFLPSATWMVIGDPSWTATYGSAFWLADVNGDGFADLVFPASGSLWVAPNNLRGGFDPPREFFHGPVPDPRYIRFGRVTGSARADMVAWTPDLAAPTVYVNDGVHLIAPAAPVLGSGAPGLQRLTAQLIDLDGDGRADLVVRGETHVHCAHSTGAGFGPLRACSIAGGPFAEHVTEWNAQYADSFGVANINGPAVVAGVPTGVIFSPLTKGSLSNRHRYLCNDCFTNAADQAWKPQLRASQIVWADFTHSGVDSPMFVRADGLYLAVTQLPK
ncbi:MAG TPA: hypothetical protein VMG40_04655 [Bryobacteraceae bacterium]|nr:hypothetical protein [Bryobacteraceae bacterium]